MIKRHGIRLAQILLLAVACTWTPHPSALEAHEGLMTKAPAALRLAVMGVGPFPVSTVYSPMALERIADEISRMRWALPGETVWPVVEDIPLVETRQKEEFWHTAARGHTLQRLRQMYHLNTAALEALNPELDLNNLQEGDRVLIWKRQPERFAKSVGAANGGRIIDAEPLPRGESYIVLYPHRAWGTFYTVSEIVRSMDAYAQRFPGSDPLIVGDISFRNGRAIHPHRSHQAGRDVDITYPRHRPPPNYNRFHHVRRDELDVEKTLWLLKQFIAGGQIEYMFIDRYHQRTLYYEARRQGAPQEWLEAVFQYPNHTGGTATIRHARGHRKHFHVRFKCQPTDHRCQ
ncbi:MAG: penicillin-insensitive murein endopeptidase [Bradymonadaceae bacterium]|nr:penicillin-insensitive murein endopeptidase [Lujinxingiaceae bacterium]